MDTIFIPCAVSFMVGVVLMAMIFYYTVVPYHKALLAELERLQSKLNYYYSRYGRK